MFVTFFINCVFRNEFLAVRNAEGGFYLCQAVQNIYKSSSKIKIRWLSQDKNDKSGEIYTPDFYDLTGMLQFYIMYLIVFFILAQKNKKSSIKIEMLTVSQKEFI